MTTTTQAPDRVLLTLNLSAGADAILSDLAGRCGGDKADVLRKAIGLMNLAVNAREEGKAVGIAERPEVLESEFSGF